MELPLENESFHDAPAGALPSESDTGDDGEAAKELAAGRRRRRRRRRRQHGLARWR